MGNILKITRLNFAALINLQVAICAAVLLLHILISVGVLRLAHTTGPAGVGDFIGMFWILIMGLIFFAPAFKYTLSQGVSRRTFFLAGGFTMVAMAAAIAVVVTIFYIINLQVSNVWMMYEMVYGSGNIAGLLVWEFAALFLLAMLGWTIRLIYYVSGRTVSIIISIAPFIIAALLALINAMVGGGMGLAVLEFLKTAMGISAGGLNPYIGVASMMVAGIALALPVFLLLRRAPVKD